MGIDDQKDLESHIWVFPELGVPPNHPFEWDFHEINHPFSGTPNLGNPHLGTLSCGGLMLTCSPGLSESTQRSWGVLGPDSLLRMAAKAEKHNPTNRKLMKIWVFGN